MIPRLRRLEIVAILLPVLVRYLRMWSNKLTIITERRRRHLWDLLTHSNIVLHWWIELGWHLLSIECGVLHLVPAHHWIDIRVDLKALRMHDRLVILLIALLIDRNTHGVGMGYSAVVL